MPRVLAANGIFCAPEMKLPQRFKGFARVEYTKGRREDRESGAFRKAAHRRRTRGGDMRISTKGRYALRLMIDIADQGEEGTLVTMRQAAERQELSVKYLEQLGGLLVKAGLLKSVRGVNGGYSLSRPADSITAGDVLHAVERSTSPVICLEEGASPCPRSESCAALPLWRGLGNAIDAYLDGVTLADLLRGGKAEGLS